MADSDSHNVTEVIEENVEENHEMKEHSRNLMELNVSTKENEDFKMSKSLIETKKVTIMEDREHQDASKDQDVQEHDNVQEVPEVPELQEEVKDSTLPDSDNFDLVASRKHQLEEIGRERGVVLEELQHGSEPDLFSRTEPGAPITDEDLLKMNDDAIKIPDVAIEDVDSDTEAASVATEVCKVVKPVEDVVVKTGAADPASWVDDDVVFDFFQSVDIEDSLSGSFDSKEGYIEGEGEADKDVVEAPVIIDREELYKRYSWMLPEVDYARFKNNLLQRRVASYFKRRKMDYVLRETDTRKDAMQKYWRKLEALGELLDMDSSERSRIAVELSELTTFRDTEMTETHNSFNAMQNRLKHIGTGLIFSKTGSEISPMKVEKMLKRQKYQTEQMAEMRMTCIRLRNSITEKEESIASLDKIGGRLTIAYFQQLKGENRSFADKIDERDDELNRLRLSVRSTMQELAHFREKSSSLSKGRYALETVIEDLDFYALYTRDILNDVHQERDKYRKSTRNLRDNSGLLIYPTLLSDMEDSLQEHEVLIKEVAKIEQEYKERSQQIKRIRKEIEMITTGQHNRSTESFDIPISTTGKKKADAYKQIEKKIKKRTSPQMEQDNLEFVVKNYE